MPKLELGDLEAVERLKDINVPQLAAYAKDGFAILTAVPSCTLMFKSEMPLFVLPGTKRCASWPMRCSTRFEYIVCA